ncbi:MAG: hypothetical protein KC900_11400 [Candidatus Omnitrophica bacterium]|nr:hypothetical protein [Candidatus Omnitrophota bacterium]
MKQSFIRNLTWHCLLICLISLGAIGALMEHAGFSLNLTFYIGWALGITFISANGTIPFVTFYRAITGRGFAEYFWLLWTTWLVLMFFLLPATYVGQRMVETRDRIFDTDTAYADTVTDVPTTEKPVKMPEIIDEDTIETDWPEQEPYLEINLDGYRA